MIENLTFTELKQSDYDNLKNLLNEIWKLDEYGTNNKANELIKEHCLFSYLTICNYTIVARINNVPIGYLFADILSDSSTFKEQTTKTLKKISKKLNHYESGRLYLQECKQIDDLNKKFYNQANKCFDSQLSLFIVEKNYQGMHIGSQLISTYYDYLKSRNLSKIYVKTDSFCNVGFYTHNNYTQLFKEDIQLCSDNGRVSQFYFFEYEL